MYCRYVNVDGLKIENPTQGQIEEFVRRYVAGDVMGISLDTEHMSGIGMNILSDHDLGYCAYGGEDSKRGSFVYESFNGIASNVLKDISIYQFPESVFFADPHLIGDAALQFAFHGTISRQMSWQFRFHLPNNTLTSEIALTADDPRSFEEFLTAHAKSSS